MLQIDLFLDPTANTGERAVDLSLPKLSLLHTSSSCVTPGGFPPQTPQVETSTQDGDEYRFCFVGLSGPKQSKQGGLTVAPVIDINRDPMRDGMKWVSMIDLFAEASDNNDWTSQIHTHRTLRANLACGDDWRASWPPFFCGIL